MRGPSGSKQSEFPTGLPHPATSAHTRCSATGFRIIPPCTCACRTGTRESSTRLIRWAGAIAFEEPQAEIDRANQLHVLHCAAPRAWTYSRVGLNGELLGHSSFMETKTRPRLVRSANGEVAVQGGVIEAPAAQTKTTRDTAPKLSDRPPGMPKDNR